MGYIPTFWIVVLGIFVVTAPLWIPLLMAVTTERNKPSA